jgi:GT2 family glycosyltransferase
VREERISRHRDRRIDIVVCVHNAYDDVERCLESLRRHRVSPAQRLILIDDGSDAPTAQLLADFARGTDWVALHRNERALRYTRAANRGLAAATGELVILLNSDVIVTDGWAEKMADAVFSTPGAGIVGPLSNAASHQSIPDHLGTAEQTAINGLVPGVTAENMNRYCERWTTADVLPRVPLVHGFCFGLTREAIERVGSFDAENFPSGYGEENDYCIRAADAGVGLVIATHTYVFHAKSKSYPDATRIALLRDGAEALSRLHGTPRIARAARSMVGHPMLEELRKHSRAFTAAWYEQSATCLSNGAGDRSAGART